MIATCQRWRDRRGAYRPAGEPIDTSRYGVELLMLDRTAKAFVVQHHYSGTFPAARLRVGLYRMRQLVGVAVFSVPMSQHTVPRWTGLQPAQGVELGRFVLLDDVPANGETWFLARAVKALRQELPDVRAIVSFSDPLERRTADGAVVMPGHVGTIYQASNARYVGRSKAQWMHIGPDGRAVSPRALAKIRNGERGDGHAADQLRRLGAPRRERGEDGRDYVERALRTGPFRRVKHPGNHTYLFAVDADAAERFPEALAYPKRRAA